MDIITSLDATTIAFDRIGTGPAVVLVNGGPTTRWANAELAGLLAERFTVINYDRRGRGDSGDTQPYAVEREIEDLAAVVAAAGDDVRLFGSSGGAVLALKAAARGVPVTSVAVWEPSYVVPGTRPAVPEDYRAHLEELLAAGAPGDAVAYFFTAAAGLPAEFVAPMRTSPFWAGMEQLAPTLVYDAQVVGDFSVPTAELARIACPVLVVDGGTTPSMSAAADATAAALPTASRQTLDGQPHNVDATALAPVLAQHFDRD